MYSPPRHDLSHYPPCIIKRASCVVIVGGARPYFRSLLVLDHQIASYSRRNINSSSRARTQSSSRSDLTHIKLTRLNRAAPDISVVFATRETPKVLLPACLPTCLSTYLPTCLPAYVGAPSALKRPVSLSPTTCHGKSLAFDTLSSLLNTNSNRRIYRVHRVVETLEQEWENTLVEIVRARLYRDIPPRLASAGLLPIVYLDVRHLSALSGFGGACL